MPKRSCALIGPGIGPKVQVGASSRVTLRGSKLGEDINIRSFYSDGTEHVHRTQGFDNGAEVLLSECAYVQVEYLGTNKGFIACVLIGGSEDALHSS